MPNRDFPPLKAWSIAKRIVALTEGRQTATQKLRPRAYIGSVPRPPTRYPRSEYQGMNIPPLAIHAVPNGKKAVEALVI